MRQLKTSIVERIEKDFLERSNLFGMVKEEVLKNVEGTTGLTKVLLKFLYAYLPLGDVADYDFDLFLSYAEHGAFLYENSEFTKEIPDEYFLNYVVAPRINSEDLTKCRPFFYEKLHDRVKGMTTGEAVLEANNWAYENATYRSTSARTASPMTLYKCGYGRCGEESTFLTTALRSLGIAARQVYVPRWSHSDSNHAWVEIFVDGEWKFTGACEPNPVFNCGWFPYAASRAIVVHSIAFSPFAYEKDEVMTTDGAAKVFNNAALYAKQKEIRVSVKNPDGTPAVKARVNFEIINSSEFFPVISVWTDEKGEFSVKLGLGTVHVYAVLGDLRFETFISVPETEELSIVLGEENADGEWEKYFLHAPESSQMASVTMTPEQEKEQGEKNAKGDVIRKTRIASYFDEAYAKKFEKYTEISRGLHNSYGNFEEIRKFLDTEIPGITLNEKERFMATLAQKDMRDAKAEVMLAHLAVYLEEAKVKAAYTYDESIKEIPADDEAVASQKDTNAEFYHAFPDFFSEYVVSGRIGIERFTDFRSGIKEILGETCPFKNAAEIWNYVNENIVTYPEQEYDTIITGPVACLKLKAGSETAKNTLFVAICRTYLIPAGLDRSNGAPRYYEGDHFVYADDRAFVGNGTLAIHFEDEKLPGYFENFTLERELPDGNFDVVFVPSFFMDMKRDMEVSLVPGTYRIVTCLRTRTGSVAGRKATFRVEDGKKVSISLTCNENLAESLLISKDISQVKSGILHGATGLGLAATMFLKIGAEPTEHVLNELIEMRNMGNSFGCPITFVPVLKSYDELEDKTFQKACDKLEPKVSFDFGSGTAEALAKATETQITSLPFLVITRGSKECIFADSGYKVGIVDMMMRVIEEAKKSTFKAPEEIKTAKEAKWDEYVTSVKDNYIKLNEFSSNSVDHNNVIMRYGMKVVGEPGENGYPVYIAMHGGGGGDTPDVNNQQWAHMGIYYLNSVKSGIYINPRGVRDTWDCHGNPESYPCYDKIIENLIVFKNADPNRVYLCGYSAGGDGVYLIAPKMADRFAAAHMSAGHHNGKSILGVRNCPIQLQVGEFDGAYGRNKVTVEYMQLLDKLQEEYGGYEHNGFVSKDCGHGFRDSSPELQPVIADPYKWLEDDKCRESKLADNNAIHFLEKYTRNPIPDKVVWDMSDRAEMRKNDDFYYLEAPKDVTNGIIVVELDKENNCLKVVKNTTGRGFKILLNEVMVDITKPVKVILSTGEEIDHKVLFSDEILSRTTLSRGDKNFQFFDEIEVR